MRSPGAHNNQEQVAGLERALRNLEAHCTDAGLLEEQQRKVVKQREEVEERLARLQSARVSGKPDKIAKKQSKLEESQAELLEAQRELEALQKLVKPLREGQRNRKKPGMPGFFYFWIMHPRVSDADCLCIRTNFSIN